MAKKDRSRGGQLVQTDQEEDDEVDEEDEEAGRVELAISSPKG